MDSLTLAYYAVIGGLLAYFAPQLGRGPARVIIGALVGVASVAVLPVLRQIL